MAFMAIFEVVMINYGHPLYLLNTVNLNLLLFISKYLYFPANKLTRQTSRGQFLALKMRVFHITAQ